MAWNNKMKTLLIFSTRDTNTHPLFLQHLEHNWRYTVEIVASASRNIHKHDFNTIESNVRRQAAR
jgi:hypothetical protein